jgi:hypothetical protein
VPTVFLSRPLTAVQQPTLAEVLFRGSARTFGTLAVLPSNVGSVEAALHFAIGLNSFSVIVGPSGWGKTHILECVSEKLSQRFKPTPLVMSATEWLSGSHSADPTLPLLLDDVQELTTRPRSRIQLRLALERRVRSGRPTMLAFTAAKRTRHLSAILPSAKDWMVGTISEPAPSERMLIIAQLAESQGLSLSTSLTKVIAQKMRGNGRTLVGALRRLRLHGPLWNDVSGTLKACGLLEPFFADSGSWDLRGHILAVSKTFDAEQFGVPIAELVAFTMLREAALCEVDVARSLKIEPGEAYARSARFEKQYRSSEPALLAVRNFSESVVEGLVTD